MEKGTRIEGVSQGSAGADPSGRIAPGSTVETSCG